MVIHELVTDGVSEEEVKIAKSNLISQQILDLSDGLDLGRSFLSASLCNKTDFMTYPLRLPSVIINVSVDDVNSILRKYIDPWSLIRVTVGPSVLDMSSWTIPPRAALPSLPSRVTEQESRTVCYEHGYATPQTALNFWFNTYGISDGKITGTFSWSSPMQDADVFFYRLWWATGCTKDSIIRSAGPIWTDIYRDPLIPDNVYTISVKDITVPPTATTILLIGHDLNGNPWSGAVGVSVQGN